MERGKLALGGSTHGRGVIAAPIAAWLVQKLNPQLMGVLVGGFIILINIQTIVQTWISNEEIHPIVYSAVALIWVTAIIFTIIRIYHKKMLHLNS